MERLICVKYQCLCPALPTVNNSVAPGPEKTDAAPASPVRINRFKFR